MIFYARLAIFAAASLALAAGPGAAPQLPPSKNAPKAGEKAPDFALPDSVGRLQKLSAMLSGPKGGEWALLIFYRGYW